MIILLFISRYGCTLFQLLLTQQLGRCWETDRALWSRVASRVKQCSCVLEKDRAKSTDPPHPHPHPASLTLHHPFSSFVPTQIQMGLMKV